MIVYSKPRGVKPERKPRHHESMILQGRAGPSQEEGEGGFQKYACSSDTEKDCYFLEKQKNMICLGLLDIN